MTKEQVHEVMMGIYPEWRYRWCSASVCGCMGGANCSGQATSKGVTHEQWLQWSLDNPESEARALIELLNIGSEQAKRGETSSTAELKERLRLKFQK